MAAKENERVEMLSDGIFAIAITLLVLELKVPEPETIHSVNEFWFALHKMWPSLFALVLSFTIILLGWLTHHGIFKLLDKTSLHFMFANAFYMLNIVVFPFASYLIAEFYSTEFATPAVVIYCIFNLLQSIAIAILLYATLHPHPLTKDEHSRKQMLTKIHGPRLAIPIEIGAAIIAFWFPHIAFFIITLMWVGIIMRIFWFHKKFSAPHEGGTHAEHHKEA